MNASRKRLTLIISGIMLALALLIVTGAVMYHHAQSQNQHTMKGQKQLWSLSLDQKITADDLPNGFTAQQKDLLVGRTIGYVLGGTRIGNMRVSQEYAENSNEALRNLIGETVSSAQNLCEVLRRSQPMSLPVLYNESPRLDVFTWSWVNSQCPQQRANMASMMSTQSGIDTFGEAIHLTVVAPNATAATDLVNNSLLALSTIPALAWRTNDNTTSCTWSITDAHGKVVRENHVGYAPRGTVIDLTHVGTGSGLSIGPNCGALRLVDTRIDAPFNRLLLTAADTLR